MILSPSGNELKIVKSYHNDEGRVVAVDARFVRSIHDMTHRYDIYDLSATHGSPELYAAMCGLPSEEMTS